MTSKRTSPLVLSKLFWTKTRHPRRQLTMIGICLIAVYGLARFAVTAHGWWFATAMLGVLGCITIALTFTYYLIEPVLNLLEKLMEEIAAWTIGLSVFAVRLYSQIRAFVVESSEKRRRREEWEARRFPSFSAPPAPFFIAD